MAGLWAVTHLSLLCLGSTNLPEGVSSAAMASMDDVRDEMWAAASRILGRAPTQGEKDKLVEAYNALTGDDIFARCKAALEKVLGVDLNVRVLLEKTASVDRVRNALANLKAIATQSVKNKTGGR